MTNREQLAEYGKEVLVLAGLHADLEKRIARSKENIEKLKKAIDDEMDVVQNEHYG